jgi:hypothetical protein
MIAQRFVSSAPYLTGGESVSRFGHLRRAAPHTQPNKRDHLLRREAAVEALCLNACRRNSLPDLGSTERSLFRENNLTDAVNRGRDWRCVSHFIVVSLQATCHRAC